MLAHSTSTRSDAAAYANSDAAAYAKSDCRADDSAYSGAYTSSV